MGARSNQSSAIVIGAGIGGLTTAALLLREGFQVTVLEAHVYAGGSAGTFYHKGYRFDAGATLAGGLGPGEPLDQLAQRLDLAWPVTPVDPAWVVHMPDGMQIRQWTTRERWMSERQRALPGSESFWQRQERLADISWELASHPVPWPPSSVRDVARLAGAARADMVWALPYGLRTVGDLLSDGDDSHLRLFLDAQLLIAAQATAGETNALYGGAALDLPRRGVYHVDGGMGALADTLVRWIRENGGEVRFRQQVTHIDAQAKRAARVHTNKGLSLEADWVVANVTPWSLQRLLGEAAPRSLQRETAAREPMWGAFTLYLGLDDARLPTSAGSHHQIIMDAARPLGEGNSVFLSLSPRDDTTRAPAGKRAATLSTHTAIAPWHALRRGADERAYLDRRLDYTNRMLAAAERALPGIRSAAELVLPGTPVTFEFYTRRAGGMVGGFPQRSLFGVRGPETGIANLKLVGDSIFPGQSTAAVALGGMRVARDILAASRRQKRSQRLAMRGPSPQLVK